MGWLLWTLLVVCSLSGTTYGSQIKEDVNGQSLKAPHKRENHIIDAECYEALTLLTTTCSTTLTMMQTTKPTTTTPKPTTTKHPGPKNCKEVIFNDDGSYVTNIDPDARTGVYTIYPQGTDGVEVYCAALGMEGPGWTVIQRRIDGSQDFYQGWEDYKNGFGDASGEYWIGNDNLHALTAKQDQLLAVHLECGGQSQLAYYHDFWIQDEDAKYKLHVAATIQVGIPPGDSLTYHNGQQFSTYDRDHDSWDDGNCANKGKGGWWYNNCQQSNLNGLYNGVGNEGINWYTWKNQTGCMSAVTMMLKEKY